MSSDKAQSSNENWDNKISFNSLTCQRYKIDLKKVFWKTKDDQSQPVNECFEIQDTDLTQFKCSNLLNELACISIKTPFQNCMYENSSCKSYSVEVIKSQPYCSKYIMINTGLFCEQTTDVPCEYSDADKMCKVIQIESNEKDYQIYCEYSHTYKRGYCRRRIKFEN